MLSQLEAGGMSQPEEITKLECTLHSSSRLRVAVRTQDRANAMKMYNDFDSVYTNGPSGGGGATMKVSEIISVFSCFVDRADVTQNVEYEVI